MFLKVTIILLLPYEFLIAAEDSTTVQTSHLPAFSKYLGNATTNQETVTADVQAASNYVTENLLVDPNPSNRLHEESRPAVQEQNSYYVLRPRGRTKSFTENALNELNFGELLRNQAKEQQRSQYSKELEQRAKDFQRQQQLQLHTIEKEEFIQSELHNLAQDIAETEINREAGKTKTSSPTSSWKSFFSSIFPQGILNVFHFSVSAESQKLQEQPSVRVSRVTNFEEPYRSKRIITEWSSTLPTTLPMMEPEALKFLPMVDSESLKLSPMKVSSESRNLSPMAPSESRNIPPMINTDDLKLASMVDQESLKPSPITDSEILTLSQTEGEEQNKTGGLMTNKDVYDINMAAEMSEIPFQVTELTLDVGESTALESEKIFQIRPFNCSDMIGFQFEDNCGEETEDYEDTLSESGDDNIVALSREAPKNIFYPTLKPVPYDGGNNIRNSDVYYSGTGTQTSDEIIRESNKNFGQKIHYHPLKQLDDFQKEVEKQFDHSAVRIDSEAASRKFLKHFKGKYVKPQSSSTENQYLAQSTTPKLANQYFSQPITLQPEIKLLAQPNSIKPESQLHTYIFSAEFKPDLEEESAGPNPAGTSNGLHTHIYNADEFGDDASDSSASRYENSNEKLPKEDNSSEDDSQSQMIEEEIFNSEKLFEPHTGNLKPESLLHTYIYSSTDNNDKNDSISDIEPVPAAPKPKAYFPPWNIPKPAPDSQGPGTSKNQASMNSWTVQKADKHQGPVAPKASMNSWTFQTNAQDNQGSASYEATKKTYLPTPEPQVFYPPQNLIEIQRSVEQQVKHTKPQVYYDFPPTPLALSQYPIRVEQADEGHQSVPSESFQQRQQYLQDQQKQLDKQQKYFEQQQVQQYQLQQQQQLLQQYQQEQEQQQRDQQKQQLQQLKQQHQLQQYQREQEQQQQQQQRDQQKLQQQQLKQQQLLQQYQQEQEQQQRDQQKQQQQQLKQQQQQQKQQHQQQQQQQQQKQQQYQEQNNKEYQQQLIRYNTVKVEKIVPKPYPVPVKEIVEKYIDRPVQVEKIVEKPVDVPYPVHEVVEKIIDRPYPVEKIIDRPVHIPYPVQVDHFIDRPYAVRVPVPVAVPVPVHQYIDRPYPVEKIVEKPVHIPYPVDKIVEKIVEKHIPVEVERFVEKPAAKKPGKKKPILKSAEPIYPTSPTAGGHTNKPKPNLDLLELVPPPVDQGDHDNYKTIPDDIEFILIDDYNGPVPMGHQGFSWNNPEKRATKNHNIKRSPEFRRNLRVEYGFRPPLIPSVEIGEKGPVKDV